MTSNVCTSLIEACVYDRNIITFSYIMVFLIIALVIDYISSGGPVDLSLYNICQNYKQNRCNVSTLHLTKCICMQT